MQPTHFHARSTTDSSRIPSIQFPALLRRSEYELTLLLSLPPPYDSFLLSLGQSRPSPEHIQTRNEMFGKSQFGTLCLCRCAFSVTSARVISSFIGFSCQQSPLILDRASPSSSPCSSHSFYRFNYGIFSQALLLRPKTRRLFRKRSCMNMIRNMFDHGRSQSTGMLAHSLVKMPPTALAVTSSIIQWRCTHQW